MLFPPGLSSYGFKYDNWGANPGTSIGTSVTPGASNAEGTYTQIASSANIAQDCYWIYLLISQGNTGGAAKNHLLDIGVDPAGGSSYTAIISNLVCGASSGPNAGNGNREHVFPFFIKAGSSVAARIQGSNGTAGTVRIGAKFYGLPSRPEAIPVGAYSQTFGTITNSNGESFTPGNAADGSYVDLGSVTKALWWWQIGYQVDNATITGEYTYIELAWGDASNKHQIAKVMHAGNTGETCGLSIQEHMLACSAYCPVPAGANIYIRGRANNAPDSGYNATVVGIGG
jgi:hypothetical protein